MYKPLALAACLALTFSTSARAGGNECDKLPSYAALQTALKNVVPPVGTPNGGLGFPMWLTLVDGSGKICAVTTSLGNSGNVTSDIWLGSRVISAQKAYTANSFSLGALSLSTAE